MGFLSESYKSRIKALAGILSEAGATSEADRQIAFAKTNERVPYKKDLMIYAIKNGLEIGLLFKTNNEKDKMPISKYRTLQPLALGTNKKGNECIVGYHKIGQSESEARKTGRRSAEIKDEWRLFKTKNILSMWFTGNKFDKSPSGFKGSSDSRMSNIEVYFKPLEAKKLQAATATEEKAKEEQKNKMINRPKI
jgi:hypothetical protein